MTMGILRRPLQTFARPLLGSAFVFAVSIACPAVAAEHDAPAIEAQAAHAEHTPPAAHGENTAPGAEGEHAAHHGEHEDVSFDDINWVYGLLAEREGEPSLLFRPPGMPAPFLATLINWGVLVSLIVVFAKKQLPAALRKRKAGIVQGMEEAGRIKAAAESRLRELEEKLGHVDEEIDTIKAEMKRASELDRERILREAEEHRTRLERDASRLIETELEAAKEQLRREVVDGALQLATEQVTTKLSSQDQQALFEEALGSLKNLPNHSLGGRA
jgi:F-type H+-transporting ATPase subunit b